MKTKGQQDLLYGTGEAPKLSGMAEVGSGGLHEKEKARLDEIIAKLNDLFEGEITEENCTSSEVLRQPGCGFSGGLASSGFDI